LNDGYFATYVKIAASMNAPLTNINSLAALGMLASAQQPKWSYVTQRFTQFVANLHLTAPQVADGQTKRNGVVACLNRAYFNSSSSVDNSFFIGSWGKNTAIRPPRDVDIYFVLPPSVYHRFDTYTGNKQSALLQEIRRVLQVTYPTTTNIRGDGPVVLVGFGSYAVEVVPAFALENSRYWVCDTKQNGSYKITAPWNEIVHVNDADDRNAKNLRPLVNMLKAWQGYCTVPIKSFYLELIAVEFLDQSPWRLNGVFWYDWITRDFFAYLINRANTFVSAPGTGELMWLGDTWKSRAESAYARAVKACEYEEQNSMILAGDEWQKIFGADIPRYV
jgi:hypothetical protein